VDIAGSVPQNIATDGTALFAVIAFVMGRKREDLRRLLLLLLTLSVFGSSLGLFMQASDHIHVLVAYRPHVDVSGIVEWRGPIHLSLFLFHYSRPQLLPAVHAEHKRTLPRMWQGEPHPRHIGKGAAVPGKHLGTRTWPHGSIDSDRHTAI
jgi:hypothetical protein